MTRGRWRVLVLQYMTQVPQTVRDLRLLGRWRYQTTNPLQLSQVPKSFRHQHQLLKFNENLQYTIKISIFISAIRYIIVETMYPHSTNTKGGWYRRSDSSNSTRKWISCFWLIGRHDKIARLVALDVVAVSSESKILNTSAYREHCTSSCIK
jgi:hypothetical protein